MQLERETWAKECAHMSSNQALASSEKSPEGNLIRTKENSGHVKLLLSKIAESSESKAPDDEASLLVLKIVGSVIE